MMFISFSMVVLLNIWPAPNFGAGQMFRQKALDQQESFPPQVVGLVDDMISLHPLNAINH
jgi:hypothetical protein